MSDEDTKHWIYAGGLPYELTEGDIVCVFSQYGEIYEISLSRDRDTGKSRGFCFIKYEDPKSCELAVDNFHGTTIIGRKIKVSYATNTNAVKSRKPALVAPQHLSSDSRARQLDGSYSRKDSPQLEDSFEDYKRLKYRHEPDDDKRYSRQEERHRDRPNYRALNDSPSYKERHQDDRRLQKHSPDRHRYRSSSRDDRRRHNSRERDRHRETRDQNRYGESKTRDYQNESRGRDHRRDSRDREHRRDSRDQVGGRRESGDRDYRRQSRERGQNSRQSLDHKRKHRDKSEERGSHRDSDHKHRHRHPDEEYRHRDSDNRHKHSERRPSRDRKSHN